jgi:hypothetical protein
VTHPTCPTCLERLDRIEQQLGRVLELLEGRPGTPASVTVDAGEVARRYGVTAAWVREHADQLGAIRLGNGPKPRLRFDPETVAAAMTVCQEGRRPTASETPAPPPLRRRRRAARTGTGAELLPIRGAGGGRSGAGVKSSRPSTGGPAGAPTPPAPAPAVDAPVQRGRYPAGVADRPHDAAAPERGADMAPTARATRRARAG